MLVLARKKYEALTVGTGESKVTITVVEIPVHRREVFDAIERENG